MKNKWVFVSHSNMDYNKVRKVRNILEDWNFRPLLFFLKCLEEDSEVSELIKREIGCRTRFLLCESGNTTNPHGWVQKEVAYIKSLDRRYDVIDIEASDESITSTLEFFRKTSTIYISHSDTQNQLAELLANRLSKYDFDVVYESANNKDYIINRAINTGCFIPIVSEDYESSCFTDILHARNAHIKKIQDDRQSKLSYSRHIPPIISIFPFDAFSSPGGLCDKTIDELWEEPCVETFGHNVLEQCDIAMRFILTSMFSWGTILAFAYNFNSDNEVLDIKEAEFLYKLISDSEQDYIAGNRSRCDQFNGLPGVLGRCYEFGYNCFQTDLYKALHYYEEELNDKRISCTDIQRELILQNLIENIERVKGKIRTQ